MCAAASSFGSGCHPSIRCCMIDTPRSATALWVINAAFLIPNLAELCPFLPVPQRGEGRAALYADDISLAGIPLTVGDVAWLGAGSLWLRCREDGSDAGKRVAAMQGGWHRCSEGDCDGGKRGASASGTTADSSVPRVAARTAR